MYRGLIHFHSEYSYDSILKIESIINFAKKHSLNFLILTDHETIEGAKALKENIVKQNLDIEIILAAEYKTSLGDIIALGIETEITNMNFDNFIRQVKQQNGILLFPHPYKGHKKINYIAEKVDLIEVFNARTDDKSNEKALLLANKYQKNIYYATDAHNYNSLENAILEFKKLESFKQSILNTQIKQVTNKKSFEYEIVFSQFIKSYKSKSIKLFIYLIAKTIKKSIFLQFFKRI